MDKQNKEDMEAFGFKKIYLLGNYGNFQGEDVPDPWFFNGFEGFEKVYHMVSRCVEDFLEKEVFHSIDILHTSNSTPKI